MTRLFTFLRLSTCLGALLGTAFAVDVAAAERPSVTECFLQPLDQDTPYLEGVWDVPPESGQSNRRVFYARQFGSLLIAVELAPDMDSAEDGVRPRYFEYHSGSKILAFCLTGQNIVELQTMWSETGETCFGREPLQSAVGVDTISEHFEEILLGRSRSRYLSHITFSLTRNSGAPVKVRVVPLDGSAGDTYSSQRKRARDYWNRRGSGQQSWDFDALSKCLAAGDAPVRDLAGYWFSPPRNFRDLRNWAFYPELETIRQDGRFLVMLSSVGSAMNGLGGDLNIAGPWVDIGCIEGNEVIGAGDCCQGLNIVVGRDEKGRNVVGRVVDFGNGAVCTWRVFTRFLAWYFTGRTGDYPIEFEFKCKVGASGRRQVE